MFQAIITFFTLLLGAYGALLGDDMGLGNVTGVGYPFLGAGLALTPAEEAMADRAAARSAAMAAAARF